MCQINVQEDLAYMKNVFDGIPNFKCEIKGTDDIYITFMMK